MKGTTPYTKKLDLFLAAALLTIILCCTLAFNRTLKARRLLLGTREQAELVSRSSELKKELKERLVDLDNALGNDRPFDDDQEYILNTIHTNSSRERIRVIEITGTTSQSENGILKSTCGATIEGSFADLVRIVRAFEERGYDGRIASATFYRYVDRKTKTTATRLKFYIQKYTVQ